jgi:hypothetical protein
VLLAGAASALRDGRAPRTGVAPPAGQDRLLGAELVGLRQRRKAPRPAIPIARVPLSPQRQDDDHDDDDHDDRSDADIHVGYLSLSG